MMESDTRPRKASTSVCLEAREGCGRSLIPAFLCFVVMLFCFSLPSFAAESVEERLVQGHTLVDMGLDHEAMVVFLGVLNEYPQNQQARKAIRKLVERLGKNKKQLLELQRAPDKSEVSRAMDDAVTELIKSVEEAEVRIGFLRAKKFFYDGKLLLACDVFHLMEYRNPDPKWLREEIRRYLAEKLPEKFTRRRKTGVYGIATADEYESAFWALKKGKWALAYNALGKWLKLSPAEKLPQGKRLEAEAKTIMERLRDRVFLMDHENRQEPWLGEAILFFNQQNYRKCINMTETLLLSRPKGDLKKKAWAFLGRTYDYLTLLYLVEKAEIALDGEKYIEALTHLIKAQEQYPRNKQVLELLAKVMEKARLLASLRQRQRIIRTAPERVKIRTIIREIPAAPKAPRRKPTAAERTLAESHYLQGIVAYAKGELEKAVTEWNKVLRLVPDHKKCRKALDRLNEELREARE